MACEVELLQLENDDAHLSIEAGNILPQANFGTPGKFVALFVSHGDQRDFLSKMDGLDLHLEGHLRRLASFRRVLGTLEDSCSGRRQASRVSSMLLKANRMTEETVNVLKQLVEATVAFKGMFQELKAIK